MCYVEAVTEEQTIKIVCDDRTLFLRSSLKNFQRQSGYSKLIQTSKSYLVNIDKVIHLNKLDRTLIIKLLDNSGKPINIGIGNKFYSKIIETMNIAKDR